MAGFNVEDFKSELFARGGPLYTSKFLVMIPQPRVVLAANQLARSVSRSIEFWCQSTDLPGVELTNGEVRRWGYGPVEKRPYVPVFHTQSLRFISDGNGDCWNYFNLWMQGIVPHDTEQGINGGSRSSPRGVPYEVEYKENYVTDVNIVVFRPDGLPVKRVILQEAYPTAVRPIQFHWGDTNDLAQFEVLFEYLDWRLGDETEIEHGWRRLGAQ